ncbi:MAG TPA: hypothetical protein VGG97_26985 [Bryobacteraceae bacterium]|jgi:hypothetical protein
MINDVIESYLDSVEEREFDAPFIALLRAMGYRDIHFLHGSFEFGKDFIAKGEFDGASMQFVFQTKAGDINLKSWSECRGQIDMLRTDSTAHPAFDITLPRKAVFVTTGRLVGGAGPAAQSYRKHLEELGELGFVTWDKQDLVEFITAHPGVCLAAGTQGAFLTMIWHVEQGRSDEKELERYSREWLSTAKSVHQISLETAVIAQLLRRTDRLDLSCMTALMLIRAVWFRAHGAEPPGEATLTAADTGQQLFRHYARHIFEGCGDDMLDPTQFLRDHGTLAAHVTYPISCLRMVEVLGLLYLLDSPADSELRDDLGRFLIDFMNSNAGVAHPVSDRWAISLIPAVLVAAQRGSLQSARNLVQNVAKWVADRYESDGLGLADSDSAPKEEVDRLLGVPFEHVKLERRTESYIATVVLDLAAMLRLGDVFDLINNDFMAVVLFPSVIEAPDSEAQYIIHSNDLAFTANMEYEDTWVPRDGWKVAPHHRRAKTNYYLQRIGRHWDHLALSSVLRDRHFPETCRHFLLN